MAGCPVCGQSNPETARFCNSCGARLADERQFRAPDTRKVVTVVFADVVGSTSLVEKLEPESARRVLDRFFEATRVVVERHGGTVEKYIGDAVVAVFGIPVLHEDDALRGVRAAEGMRRALATLNENLEESFGIAIEMRVGVATGEVVAGDASRAQGFATGDAVNVAARLEATAGPGDILVDEPTYRLVRRTARADPVGRVALKGRSEPVATFRLRGVETSIPVRRIASHFVGREHELEALATALVDVERTGRPKLVTVVGSAGVGKSRLVDEFLAGSADTAAALRGRCLPYGEGITYWPLKEAIAEASGLRGDANVEEARARIRALVAHAPDADLIIERVAEMTGLVEAPPEHAGTAWACRRLLEELSREQPLVVVLDDLQWAEATLLELIEHVAREGKGPILLLGMARPELLQTRHDWGAASGDRSTILALERLSDDESDRLVGSLLGGVELDGAAREKIVEAAGGLPLFIEEMVAMLVENGSLRRVGGRWVAGDLARLAVPSGIHALLGARADQLPAPERAVLQRAAVEGQVFHRSAVEAISPPSERGGIESRLSELVVKELVEPADAVFSGDEAYRFHHLLLRDVAYESLPKEERSALHSRFAGWVDDRAGERSSEYDEIVGYHLEQSYRYQAELRPTADHALAERAAERLASAGVRAYARGDWPATASLLTRATELLPARADRRLELESKLSEAMVELRPARPHLVRRMRCFLRLPPGHAWTARSRGGSVLLRCSRCGREQAHRYAWHTTTMPSDVGTGRVLPGGDGGE